MLIFQGSFTILGGSKPLYSDQNVLHRRILLLTLTSSSVIPWPSFLVSDWLSCNVSLPTITWRMTLRMRHANSIDQTTQDTRYKIFYLSCCVYNYTHIGLFTHKIWYMWHIYNTNCDTKMWYIHIKLSNYAILYFLIKIEIRFPVFTSSLDFKNYISLNMLGFCK